MQEENNGEHVRYIIREWKQLRLFSLYLPTKVKNTGDVALKMVRVIEVARIDHSPARTFTNTYEPRNLKNMLIHGECPYRRYLGHRYLLATK